MADDLAADYARAGFGGQLALGCRPALLMVDFARAYFDPGSPLEAGVGAIVEPARRLAEAARAAGAPVIFTRVVYRNPFEGGLFRRKVAALAAFEEGNPLGEFPEALGPERGDLVLEKHYPSAFFGTPLASILTARGVDTLMIAGLSTSGCVRASAVDALCHGFVPVVARDAVGDRDPRVHEANLFDLQAKTAELKASPELLAWLGRVARPRPTA